MELQEIRKEINKIDDAMRELFDARLQCSKQVAKTKIETGDSIYKPEREKEILTRFSGEGSGLYRLYMRKIMQLSRFYQYREFWLAGQKDEAFRKVYGNIGNEAYANGGSICVTLETDPISEKGMSVQEVLSVLGDFGGTIQTLQVQDAQVVFVVGIPEDAVKRQHMELLFYMLYKESVRCEFSVS